MDASHVILYRSATSPPNLSQTRHHKVIACYRADVFATTEVAPPCGVGEQQEGVGYGVWGKGKREESKLFTART